jgi:hypothetical protein
MNASIYKRVEMKFWELTIQTLSENQQVRQVVRNAYQATHSGELRRVMGILIASAFAGLASGAVLCVFSLYVLK